jgi:hypothetical protein
MAERNKKQCIGFDFIPEVSAHHFVLILPRKGEPETVLIEERYTYGEADQQRCPEPRARVDGYIWGRIAETVQSQFNRRLKDAGRKPSKFSPGENLLAPYLGKELTLLLWALEGIDPTDLPNAVANWLGFAPEERWWLYTTVKTSGATPDTTISRGWRKAICIAFAEAPAPPPAEDGRGLIAEPLPVFKGGTDTLTEDTAALPKAKTPKRKTDAEVLSLFE